MNKNGRLKIILAFVTLLMVIGILPLFSGKAYAAESSYVYVSTHIKDSSDQFGGGQVMISGSPIYGGHDYYAANGYHCEFSVTSSVMISAQPSEGYHFVEWQRGNYDEYGYGNFQVESYSSNTTHTFSALDSNYYLFAIFEKDAPETCTVTFDTRGGDTIDQQVVVKGEKAIQPDDPSKDDPGWAYFEGWYSDEALTTPFSFSSAITDDITVYAKWIYGLSIGTYNLTTNQSDSQCGRFGLYKPEQDNWDNDNSGNCNFMLPEGTINLKAYPNNGYRFVGWYEGQYIGGASQDMEPIDLDDSDTLLSDTPTYSFALNTYTCVIPVFEEAPLVNFVDIGNVWTLLDPINEVPFTAEINPNEEGLSDYIELTDERWESADAVISKSVSGVPVLGETYVYTAVVSAKGNNTFDPDHGFRFIYGGAEYDWDDITVTFKDGNKTAEITGFVPDQTIKPVNLSSATVTGIATKTYTGKALTQNPTVKMTVNGSDVTLEKDKDYTLSYKNNTKKGTASVIITGTGSFTGSITKKFTIKARSASKFSVSGVKAKTYTGKALKQSLVVKDGSTKLKSGQDYAVTYKNNKNVGKATISIKGKGNYTGTKTVTFKINPKGTSLSSLTAGTKRFTVKWKKQATKMSKSVITGYQIQYSTSSTFKSGNKTATVKGYSKTSKAFTSLKAKKKYYVRIRTYKTVSGVKYYSPWSTKKAVTTKAAATSKSKASTGSGTVYWTPSGAVYHLSRNCPTLSRSKTVLSGSISASGKPRACKVCGH